MANDVIVVTGAKGVGKTNFVATYTNPTREELSGVYYHDAEKSANDFIEGLKVNDLAFGHYVDLGSRFTLKDDLLSRIAKGDMPWVNNAEKNALTDYYLYVLDDLKNNLKQDKYKVYIHDPIEKLEAGMAAWVETHKKQAGVGITAYGKLWTDGVYPLYEQMINAIFARGVQTIMLTSHLRTPWEGNKPIIGKVEPGAKKLLYRLARLMIWLVRDDANNDGAPAGLVLKARMMNMRVVEGKWQNKSTLPERVPHCTWDDIREYQRVGCDKTNPAPRERMSESERQMISELLTDEQMRLMILGAEKDLEETKQQGALLGGSTQAPQSFDPAEIIQQAQSQTEEVAKLHKEGKTNTEISQALSLPLPKVIAIVKGLS